MLAVCFRGVYGCLELTVYVPKSKYCRSTEVSEVQALSQRPTSPLADSN